MISKKCLTLILKRSRVHYIVMIYDIISHIVSGREELSNFLQKVLCYPIFAFNMFSNSFVVKPAVLISLAKVDMWQVYVIIVPIVFQHLSIQLVITSFLLLWVEVDVNIFISFSDSDSDDEGRLILGCNHCDLGYFLYLYHLCPLIQIRL